MKSNQHSDLQEHRRFKLNRISEVVAGSLMFMAAGQAYAQQDQAIEEQALKNKQEETVEIINITGSREKYRPLESASATKFDLLLVETPQAISVLDQSLLETTESENFQDIASLVPGISSPGTDGVSPFLFSRGVQLSPRFGYKINGAESQRVVVDFSAVERVESIRGPASVIFGQTDFGGILNTVLKSPSYDAQRSAAIEVGEFNSYRGELNLSGPVNEDESIRARGDFAIDSEDSFQDFRTADRLSGHVSVDFDLSADTTLYTSLYVFDFEGNTDFGFPVAGFNDDGEIVLSAALNGDITNVPRNLFFGASSIVPGQENPGTKQDGYFLIAELEHEFDNDIQLDLKVARFNTSVENRQPSMYGLYDDGSTLLYDFYSSEDFESHTFNASLKGEFDLFGETHRWLVDGYYRTLRNDNSRTISTGIGTVDFFAPDLSDIPTDTVVPSELDEQRDELDDWAISTVLLLEPVERLTILLGGRFQGTDEKTDTFDPSGNFLSENFNFDDSDFLPRLGITYGITEDLFIYGSYSEGIIFNGGLDANGSALPPETGEQIEFGVKAEFFEQKLGTSLIYYMTDRTNFAVPDPTNPLFDTTVDGGEFNGIELEIIGEPTPGLNLLLTYSYQGNSVTQAEGEGFKTVDFVPNVPEHSVSFFTSYEFLEDSVLSGLRLGAGIIYEGDRAADFGNVGSSEAIVTLPSYTRFDLSAGYFITDDIQVYANWKNVTDEDIIGSFFNSPTLGLTYIDVSEFSGGVKFKF